MEKSKKSWSSTIQKKCFRSLSCFFLLSSVDVFWGPSLRACEKSPDLSKSKFTRRKRPLVIYGGANWVDCGDQDDRQPPRLLQRLQLLPPPPDENRGEQWLDDRHAPRPPSARLLKNGDRRGRRDWHGDESDCCDWNCRMRRRSLNCCCYCCCCFVVAVVFGCSSCSSFAGFETIFWSGVRLSSSYGLIPSVSVSTRRHWTETPFPVPRFGIWSRVFVSSGRSRGPSRAQEDCPIRPGERRSLL